MVGFAGGVFRLGLCFVFNVKKLVSFTLCGLLVFGLGACNAGDDSSATRKKAWYPPSSTPDASATPTDDASPVVGPDPANPHLIPRPFVNPDGSLNPPTEPDLTDHSEQGVRKASEFFMQVVQYYSQTNDKEFFRKYFDPDSQSGQYALEDWEGINSLNESGKFYYLEDFETVFEDPEVVENVVGAKGSYKAFSETTQTYEKHRFAVAVTANPETNKLWVYELIIGASE